MDELISLMPALWLDAADVISPAPGWSKRSALTVGKLGQRLIVAGVNGLRIVEFVAADDCTGRTKRTISQEARLTVSEMHLALGEACHVTEQAEHAVRGAFGVLQRFAQHHKATALAVNRFRACELGHAGTEIRRRGKLSGVKFGVAAG